MNVSFLEYYKMILEKVSFDKHLFSKEYKKALRYMDNNEVASLNKWLLKRGFKSELVAMNNAKPNFSKDPQLRSQA